MNKRLVFGMLSAGLAVILILGGAGLYKIHTLKVQMQNLLNTKLEDFALKTQQKDVTVSYKPFKCSGLVFVECKNEEIAFQSSLFTSNVLSFKNIQIKADEIDFKSLTFLIDSDISAPEIEGVDAYMEAFFPKHLKMRMKLLADSKESYKIDTRLLLTAKNIDYQEEIDAILFSDELKNKGFFYAIENLDFSKKKTQIKNIILTLTSKDLNSELLRIVKDKYGQWGEGMIGVMVGASMMQFEGNKQIQEMIAGFGALAMGEAKRMKVFITPIDLSSSVAGEILDEESAQVFELLLEKYNFETKLEN